MGMLAMLLSMMKAAGGDQKDHSCVIPLCAGYRRSTYIYSKFCVYPPDGVRVRNHRLLAGLRGFLPAVSGEIPPVPGAAFIPGGLRYSWPLRPV